MTAPEGGISGSVPAEGGISGDGPLSGGISGGWAGWAWMAGFAGLAALGAMGFFSQLHGAHPERAWRAYHINFLLWSAMAQGGLLFSIIMHLTSARWTRRLSSLAESMAAFFPVSLALFIALFIGREALFPWLNQDLHGKEAWLNMPFLFTRDLIGFLILYGLGFGYIYYALKDKIDPASAGWAARTILRIGKGGDSGAGGAPGLAQAGGDRSADRYRMTVLAVLYALAYAIVLSLVSFDLVMSMDPHWISTLFGPYSFVKAFYLGLGALLILASLSHLIHGDRSGLTSANFHDLGKLFFGFCLVWADFFYCQFVVIWYGNIPEETHYVIQRTATAPWEQLAWTVFIVCFVAPFFILLNKKVKTKPAFMMVLSAVIIAGLWLEHLLLLGPAWQAHPDRLPIGLSEGVITLGFFGLMALAVRFFLNLFPELFRAAEGKTD